MADSTLSALPPSESISIALNTSSCTEDVESRINSPNISCHHPAIRDSDGTQIGSITAQLLNKRAMQTHNPSTMWQECQAFDASHGPETKLEKVENFLSNESFPADKQVLIDEVEFVLFIQEVYLQPEYRGRGGGLLAVELLIRELRVGEGCVVLLQAAAMGRDSRVGRDSREGGFGGVVDAHERLVAYWRRMGFEAWSWTDEAWLCLATGCRGRGWV